MPAKRPFDATLDKLQALRRARPDEAAPELARALKLANNLLVAKAAELALHHDLRALTPDLVAAFPRHFENPAKSDPQCWAKNAIAKTLAAFEYPDSALYLTGLRHRQLEGSWSGATDSAGPLRSTCALALAGCRDLPAHRILVELTPLFADTEIPVQAAAARAVASVGVPASALLLRLRAELGSGGPELLGACYAGVLALEGASALPWAARFLAHEDDAAAEAALAMADTHAPEAFTLLRTAFLRARDPDPWYRAALLSAAALTRQEDATAWLLSLVEKEPRLAEDAAEALCRAAPSASTLARLDALGRLCR